MDVHTSGQEQFSISLFVQAELREVVMSFIRRLDLCWKVEAFRLRHFRVIFLGNQKLGGR